jgi:hypothetical protein
MKNTLPLGFAIFVIVIEAYLIISATLQNDNEGTAYTIVYIILILLWIGFLFLINFGILNLFKMEVDWTLKNNIQSAAFDLLMIFIANGFYNLLTTRNFFSFPELGLTLASLAMAILLCWRVVSLFLTR